MKVEKRDGTIQEFRFEKIERVIQKVFSDKAVNEEVPEKFVEQVKQYFDNFIEKHDEDFVLPIEDIQDVIRDFLIKKNKIKAAESFILYRRKREDIRDEKSWLTKEITRKLKGNDVENQNANLDEASFGGRVGEAARVVTKNDALKNKMSKRSRENHLNNEIYIHDLDSVSVGMHNCLSIPYDKLLASGFNTRQTDVRSAHSVNTACQLVAVIAQLQSLQQFGGVSATHIDWTMVPYIRISFNKHFRDGLKYIEKQPEQSEVYKNPSGSKIEDISIEESWYKAFPNAYEYAIDMTEKEIHQGIEGLYHNLNTLQSRSGNQLPFTSINYGTCTLPEGRMFTKALLEVSIEGLGKFGRTSIFPCGIFQYAKGINDKPGTPNYDLYKLALESTSKRLYPNYANINWSVQENQLKQDRKQKQEYIDSLSEEQYNKLVEQLENNPNIAYKLGLLIDNNKIIVDLKERPIEMFSTMGCRTVNGLDINALDNFKDNIQYTINGEFDKIDDIFSGVQKDGRGNICPVTIILPTLAMQAKEKVLSEHNNEDMSEDEFRNKCVEAFMDILDKKLFEAKDMLIERFRHIASQSPKSAKFMYENHTMAGYHENEGIVSALKHGTIVIGQLGVAETLIILIGKDQTTDEGMELAKRIENLYLKRTGEFKQEYHLNFGNYMTPAESLCYTAFKKWKEKYGEMEDVTYYYDCNGNKCEKEYFTNSIHVPVYKQISPYKKIDIECQLTGLSNAGCITYTEVDGSVIHNIEALEELVNYAMEHNIPYFAVNVPADTCEECGYQGQIPGVCPKCGSDHISRLRRVTGYLTGDYKSAFNHGKQVEADQRVRHKDIIEFGKSYLDN